MAEKEKQIVIDQYGAATAERVFDDMSLLMKKYDFPSRSLESFAIANDLPMVYWMCAFGLVELLKATEGGVTRNNILRVIPSGLLRILTERMEEYASKLVEIFREITELEHDARSSPEMKEMIEEELQNVLYPSVRSAQTEFREALDEALEAFYCTHTHVADEAHHDHFSFLEDFYTSPIELLHAKTIKLEVQGMAGGEEAWRFASELCDMYYEYLQRNGHGFRIEKLQRKDGNLTDERDARYLAIRLTREMGFRQCASSRDNHRILRCLFSDSGVHRIQRVPQTETSGRMHTSTASICVIPEITLQRSEQSLTDSSEISLKTLEEECDISWTHGSGPGGQAVNTSSNCCVLLHRPTRITMKCHQGRSVIENKRVALQNLRTKLKAMDDERKQQKLDQIRGMQAHTGERNEKIRSFNTQHNIVLDHRLDFKVDDCDGMLSCRDGGSGLLAFHERIIEKEEGKRIAASVLELQQALFAALFS